MSNLGPFDNIARLNKQDFENYGKRLSLLLERIKKNRNIIYPIFIEMQEDIKEADFIQTKIDLRAPKNIIFNRDFREKITRAEIMLGENNVEIVFIKDLMKKIQDKYWNVLFADDPIVTKRKIEEAEILGKDPVDTIEKENADHYAK